MSENSKKLQIVKPGVHVIRLSLESNAFDFLNIYSEIKNEERIKISALKVKLIALIGFYECFLKWTISLEDKNKLLRKKGDSFDQEKYDSGNFSSIGLSECLSIAVSRKWIKEEERKTIIEFAEIRNKIVHFALVGEIVFFETNAVEIDLHKLDEQNKIISELLNLFQGRYSRAIEFEYKELMHFYYEWH